MTGKITMAEFCRIVADAERSGRYHNKGIKPARTTLLQMVLQFGKRFKEFVRRWIYDNLLTDTTRRDRMYIIAPTGAGKGTGWFPPDDGDERKWPPRPPKVSPSRLAS